MGLLSGFAHHPQVVFLIRGWTDLEAAVVAHLRAVQVYLLGVGCIPAHVRARAGRDGIGIQPEPDDWGRWRGGGGWR